MNEIKKVSSLPVMRACCKTCPFKKNEKNQFQDSELANTVIERNMFKGQQICHGTEGKNREANNRCKGYYDYSIDMYKRIFGDRIDEVLNDPNFNQDDEQ